jgi:hypothetical protein
MLRLTLAAAAVATVLAAPATAVGPAPGDGLTLAAGPLRYAVVRSGGATTVRLTSVRDAELRRSTRLAGAWGIPRVAFDGTAGGLSHDGGTLVLVEPTHGALARPSQLALLDARAPALQRVVSLPGRFAFDALSPDGGRVYLVEYVTVVGSLRYRVRAYDVRTGRLQRGVIADKRSGWTAMEGEPLARATSDDGTWVYTLYGNDTRPFVHALNTAQGYAVCVDLPLDPSTVAGLRLGLHGTRLSLATRGGEERAAIDTVSLRVVR